MASAPVSCCGLPGKHPRSSSWRHMLPCHSIGSAPPLARWLVSNRRDIGVAFAAIQLYHAALLAVLVFSLQGFAASRGVRDIGLGLVAYFFVFSMAVTSFDSVRRRMDPRRWRALHQVGLHYLWFGITSAYRVSGSYYYVPIV